MAQFYHFAQPNENAPIKILNPVESQITGFQAIAWRTSLYPVTVQKNSIEAVISSFNPDYEKGKSGMCAIEFQKNWGGTLQALRKNGINAWDSAKYGNHQDNVKLSFGGMIAIPFSTPPYLTDSNQQKYPASYADFYLRGIDTKISKSYWLQFCFYDNRGAPGNHFIGDVFTAEDTFIGTIGNNVPQYMTLTPGSNSFTQQTFTDSRFFGASVSRRQFANLMTGLKGVSNKNYSLNPDDHRIFAFGGTPEIARADTGACMSFSMNNLFLRTEY